MTIKILTFDLWNTLVQNTREAKKMQDEMGRLLGFKDRGDFWDYCDNHYFSSKEEFLVFLEKLCKIRNLDREKSKKVLELWKDIRNRVEIYPDVINVLEQVKTRYKMAILSNSSKEEGETVLNKFGLKKYFDVIFISCEVGLGKPDPRFFKLVPEYFGVKPSEICLIGDDYEKDMIPASYLGFKTILIDRQNKMKKLKDVDAIINSLDELIDILERW